MIDAGADVGSANFMMHRIQGPHMLAGIKDTYIVLIEPSQTQSHIIRRQFAELGISHYEECGSGAQAIKRLGEIQPDLVIAAMHLPDMTSIELVHRLRENEFTRDTPFMLISTVRCFRELDPIKQAGATAVLPKPFNTLQLKQALYATLENLEPQAIELENMDVESMNVLVVDDSRLARRQIIRTLHMMGLEKFTEAADGVDAIPLIDSEYYDLVVTDYNMPQMDGKCLVDYIRQQSHQPSVPILMVTTEGNRSKLAAVEQSGVSAICDKPFDARSVKGMVEAIMVH